MTAPAARPVRGERDDERHDRDRAEVPDHDISERVVDGARDERVARGARAARGRATRRTAERARRTRAARGRAAAGCGAAGRPTTAAAPSRAPRGGPAHAQSRQIMRFSSASWWRGSTRKQLGRGTRSRGGARSWCRPRPARRARRRRPLRPRGRRPTVRSRSTTSSASSTSSGWSSSSRSTTSSSSSSAPPRARRPRRTATSTTGDDRRRRRRRASSSSTRTSSSSSSSKSSVERRPRRGLPRRARARPRTRRRSSSASCALVRRAQTCGWRSTAEPSRCFPTRRSARLVPLRARGPRSITPRVGRGDAPSRLRPDSRGWTDGSRRPVGPLGGPACTRQTGYRNVLYLISWTAARAPRFALPPRRSGAAFTAAHATRSPGASSSPPQIAARCQADARTVPSLRPGTAARRCRSTVARNFSLTASSDFVQPRAARRASAARSADKRSRSYVSVVDVRIAAAIARCPACSAIARVHRLRDAPVARVTLR